MNAEPITLSTYAMATRFELVMYGDDPIRLRAAGEEALQEIELLDKQLSLYRPESDISWINAHAAEGPVRVEPQLFSLLRLAYNISVSTEGAFDITITPLLRAWGLAGGAGRVPAESELAQALDVSGMHRVILDDAGFTVQYEKPGVEIDLGAIGKGYAIERAVEILVEHGVASALLHGGTSTVYGIGAMPDGKPWKIAIRHPVDELLKETVDLYNSSLAVSAVHGKFFEADGRKYGHIIDPRTGKPAGDTSLTAVWGPSPACCDALSTAILVLGKDWLPEMRKKFTGYEGLVVRQPG